MKSTKSPWSYTGDTGPAYWHTLDPAYRIAKDGAAQSPINIVAPGLTTAPDKRPPEFHYRPGAFIVENNGHTIEFVPEDPGASFIVIDRVQYGLSQFHFHAPSEHTLDNAALAMELHLVHGDSQGNLAVVGVFITQGQENAALGESFARLPPDETARPRTALNPADLLPRRGPLYRYTGSLTTPPCTEGVIWHIFAEPIQASAGQVRAFTALYNRNNRPVQPLNNRTITVFPAR